MSSDFFAKFVEGNRMAAFDAQKKIRRFLEAKGYGLSSESPLFMRKSFDDIDVEVSYDPHLNRLIVSVWEGSGETQRPGGSTTHPANMKAVQKAIEKAENVPF